MTKRVEPTLTGITPDKEQIDSFHSRRSVTPAASETPQAPSKSSPALTTFLVIAYLGLAGTGYFFYQENEKLKATLANSNSRIAQLEDQLSATGEEMGESTVALRAKLEAITEKTNTLWGEMDKLWASAWRRNQTEIKELRTFTIKQPKLDKKQDSTLANLNKTVGDIQEKQTAAEFNVEALSEQLSSANNLKADLGNIRTELANLQQKSQGRDSQQLEVATAVSELDMSLKMLIERIEKLETQKRTTAGVAKPAGANNG